eukprot:Seg1853.9 transcript_id=Seg1853.9/GoldUCD/mRNA.D3Y31 product="hypothetical protein" protein_id=Seg1853.9/GoldUCD/D3Y31
MATHFKVQFLGLVAALLCVTSVAALKCYKGTEGKALKGIPAPAAAPASITCGKNDIIKKEYACSRSLACTSANGKITTRMYHWACIEKSECKNVKNGKGSATVGLAKGECCLTDDCNKGKLAKCTQGNAATNLASFMAITFGLLFTYMMS